MSAVYEFESLDWVQNILQAESQPKKKHVDPMAAFNFEDDFSVGTIHGKNDAAPPRTTGAIEITTDDEVSIISSKTQDDLAAAGGTQVASGSMASEIGLTAEPTPAGATGPAPVAAEGSPIPSGTGQVGSVDGRPGGE